MLFLKIAPEKENEMSLSVNQFYTIRSSFPTNENATQGVIQCMKKRRPWFLILFMQNKFYD